MSKKGGTRKARSEPGSKRRSSVRRTSRRALSFNDKEKLKNSCTILQKKIDDIKKSHYLTRDYKRYNKGNEPRIIKDFKDKLKKLEEEQKRICNIPRPGAQPSAHPSKVLATAAAATTTIGDKNSKKS